VRQKNQIQLKPKHILTLLLLSLMIAYPTQATATNSTNNLLLERIEQYLRDTSYLIDEAEALQRDDARYRFRYDVLRQDLSEMSNSINRFITQNKRSQMPRIISPLVKEY
jgi:RAQPRD family integrative conjugative element protein